MLRCCRLSICTIRGLMTCVFYLPMPGIRVLNCYENYDLKILSILFFTWNKRIPFDGMPLTTTEQWEWDDSFHDLITEKNLKWCRRRSTSIWAISKRGTSITSIEDCFIFNFIDSHIKLFHFRFFDFQHLKPYLS